MRKIVQTVYCPSIFTGDIYSENKYIYINNTCVSNVVVCMVAHAANFFIINIDFR